MIVVAGILMVTVSVFRGFLLEGGPFGVLVQPVEVLIICGATLGTLVYGRDGKGYADRDSLLRDNPLDPTNRRVSVIVKRRPQAGTLAAAPAPEGTPPATDGAERLRHILGAATSWAGRIGATV
jgi:hypothetical protein